ncbi:hypothetical protein KSP39_PZI012997 [Platanthera zijinensis]|uniref:DNA/RNA-binding protein Alba-like domain-containing protein n=1 Tax=Platanthera zijinensis TaxID=2320716 RepID=A0AAP0G458_9ASPA
MLLSPINAMLHLFFVQVTVISYNGIAEPEDNAVEDVLGELRVHEKHAREIVFKAIGQAINKAIAVSEIIKLQKRIHGLHQDTSISSVSITDVWEPIEEGLVPFVLVQILEDGILFECAIPVGELAVREREDAYQ